MSGCEVYGPRHQLLRGSAVFRPHDDYPGDVAALKVILPTDCHEKQKTRSQPVRVRRAGPDWTGRNGKLEYAGTEERYILQNDRPDDLSANRQRRTRSRRYVASTSDARTRGRHVAERSTGRSPTRTVLAEIPNGRQATHTVGLGGANGPQCGPPADGDGSPRRALCGDVDPSPEPRLHGHAALDSRP